VSSVVLSLVLFKTAVFRPWWQGDFWSNAIGAAEEYHFTKLKLMGHRPFIDTDVAVRILKRPHFPLDESPNSLSRRAAVTKA
jgi:hypothetical protein